MSKLYTYMKHIVSYLLEKMNKSMTRKLVQTFTFSIVITYFILLGLLGEEGYLHARSINRELDVLRKKQEALILQVDSLEQQKNLMSSQDALKDAAFRFGYQVEGEQVFYFTDVDEKDHPKAKSDVVETKQRKPFPGFSKHWIALMALAFSSLFTVVWGIGVQRRDRHR